MKRFEWSSVLMHVEFALLIRSLPSILYKCFGCSFILSARTHCNHYFLWDNRNVIIPCSVLDINGAVMQYSISDKKPTNQEKKEGKKTLKKSKWSCDWWTYNWARIPMNNVSYTTCQKTGLPKGVILWLVVNCNQDQNSSRN